MKTTPITPAHLAKAMTYTQYREMIDKLLAENKTTGSNHSEEMVEYTRMNAHRMRRVEKTTVLDDELVQLLLSVQTKMVWVVLTEAWCGDAAQNLPAIVKIADASPLIEVKLLLRDENPDIMDEYLTNGGRSIPKLIALNADTMEELGTWGPRPEPAQRLYLDMKAQDVPFKEFSEKLHGWYAKDRSQALQNEFKTLLCNWSELISPEGIPVERCS
ncbi:thioredoxin family protein [Pontibacter sp. 172403-2]|uniref:thioredoxin family protein n=1 Tax=Pontibacter rufus TaxID=2791028 RepID=UPI0018AFAFB2|nr:thioredoxin family protein [Pontibacter sp. 172403-2]MBF9252040.1 thioredoxin family protein [Pontibacter sp. 172403-2]